MLISSFYLGVSVLLLLVGSYLWLTGNKKPWNSLLSKLQQQLHQISTRKDLPAASKQILNSSSDNEVCLDVDSVQELPFVRFTLLDTEVCYLQPGDHIFRKEASYHKKAAGKRTLDAIYLGQVSGTHYVVQFETSANRDEQDLLILNSKNGFKSLHDALDSYALESELGNEIAQLIPKIQIVPISLFLRREQSFYVYLYDNARYHNIDDDSIAEIFAHVEKFKLDCTHGEQPTLDDRRFMIAPHDTSLIGKAPVTIFMKDSEAYECSKEEQSNMAQFHGHGHDQEFSTMVEIPESEIKNLPRALSRTQVIGRALQAVGLNHYDINRCNSMHFAHWVCTGCSSLLKAPCPQFWMTSPSKDHVCKVKHLVNKLYEDLYACS